jgi:acid phosphatase family membrane protein YuiD
VRRSVGKQAKILNTLLEDIHQHKKHLLIEKRLKELIGHTPVEVLSGAILGIVIANIML